MTPRYEYVANGISTHSCIDAKDLDPNAYLSLGEIDQFKFKRYQVSKTDADLLLKKRITKIREKYDYIRVWFSGGRDSRLVLETAIKYGIHIDEIVTTRRICNDHVSFYPEFEMAKEVDTIAIPYLKSIKHLLKKTKITILELDSKHHELFFKNKDWHKLTSNWYFNTGTEPIQFYKYVNPTFGLLTEPKNYCNMFGSAIPSVYKNAPNRGWKFHMSDSLLELLVGTEVAGLPVEDLLLSNDEPAVLESFVNSIADAYTKNSKLYTSNVINGRHIDAQRSIRDMSVFYQDVSIVTGVTYLKTHTIKPLTDHGFWMENYSPKMLWTVGNRFLKNPMPLCFKYYLENADWDMMRLYRETHKHTKTLEFSLQ